MSLKVIVHGEFGTQRFEIARHVRGDLLGAAEDVGGKLPFGCRSGSCGACLVEVIQGRDALGAPDPVEQDTLSRCEGPHGSRLACRAHLTPQNEDTLELRIPASESAGIY
ncbi:MAG: (2Fe-2S)-binding protein [Bdellovibrionales bacterium]|nr:(2Fe-2S)-binding protein [Bdellovibrionales bacterium]